MAEADPPFEELHHEPHDHRLLEVAEDDALVTVRAEGHQHRYEEVQRRVVAAWVAVGILPVPAAHERAERERMLPVPAVVDAVTATALLADDGADLLVGASDIYDEHMLPVGVHAVQDARRGERLAGAGRTVEEDVVVAHEVRALRLLLHVENERYVPQTVGQPYRTPLHASVERLVLGQGQGRLQLGEHQVVPAYLAARPREGRVPDDRC